MNVGTNGLICMQICVCRLLSLYWDGTGVRFLLYLICGGTQCRYARICTVHEERYTHCLQILSLEQNLMESKHMTNWAEIVLLPSRSLGS